MNFCKNSQSTNDRNLLSLLQKMKNDYTKFNCHRYINIIHLFSLFHYLYSSFLYEIKYTKELSRNLID